MSIKVELVSITEILVETETDIESSPEDSLAAHQAYNKFMQAATNFNAKQRIDRAKAKAKREAKAAAEREMKNTKMSIPSRYRMILILTKKDRFLLVLSGIRRTSKMLCWNLIKI